MQDDSCTVHISGSTGTPYVMTFTRSGYGLYTTCTCQAGRNRTHCKHRIELLEGNLSSVIAPIPEGLANRLSAMLQDTPVQSALEAVANAEAEAKASADKLKRAKKNLDKVMHL